MPNNYTCCIFIFLYKEMIKMSIKFFALLWVGLISVMSVSAAGPTFWSTTGNAGTNANINFIGTTDTVGLTFRTNNVVRMSLTSSVGTGWVSALVTQVPISVNAGPIPKANLQVMGSVMFGDNSPLTSSLPSNSFSSILWWGGNSIVGIQSTIAWGTNNQISNKAGSSFIGAWIRNTLQWMAWFIWWWMQNNINWSRNAIVWGEANSILGNVSDGFIGGWSGNHVQSNYATIVGGRQNTAWQNYSAIVWGRENVIAWWRQNQYGFIGGGKANYMEDAEESAIVGGVNNIITANVSLIGGWHHNQIAWSVGGVIGGWQSNMIQNVASLSFIGGWDSNIIDNGPYGVIVWWRQNQVKGSYSSIVGGNMNNITDSEKSFIGWGWSNRIAWSLGSNIVWGESNSIISTDTNMRWSNIIWWSQNHVTNSNGSNIMWSTSNIRWGIRNIIIGANSNILDSDVSTIFSDGATILESSNANIFWASTIINSNTVRSFWFDANFSGAANSFFWNEWMGINTVATMNNVFLIGASNWVGINTATPTDALTVNGYISTSQAYKAPSGNVGITQTITLSGNGCTVQIEAGIITSTSC